MFTNIKKMLYITLMFSFISFSLPSALKANDTNFSVAVELARAEKVDKLVEKINGLNYYLKDYIYSTADVTPTIPELNSFANLDNALWLNYDGDLMVLAVNDTHAIFTNIFTSEPSDTLKSFFINNPNLSTLSVVDSITLSLSIPHDSSLRNFIKNTKELLANPNIIVSTTTPTSSVPSTWYKPDGNGGYEIYSWDETTNSWKKIGNIDATGGTTSSGTSGMGANLIVDSMEQLNSLPAFKGMTAMVGDGKNATEYVYDGEKWLKIKGGADSLFDGEATIPQIASEIFDSVGGSKATASAPNSEFVGIKQFIKKDNQSTGGFWTTDSYDAVIGENISQLTSQSWSVGTHGFIKRSSSTVYYLQLKDVIDYGNAWVYVVKTISELATNFDDIESAIGNHGKLVYVENENKYYYYASNVWYSTDGKHQVSNSPNGRNVFTTLNSGFTYYITLADCTSSNCNGEDSTNYYAGDKHDGMYVFYFSSTGKRENNLIDAIPRASISSIYDNDDACAIYNGRIYCKTLDSRSRTIYMRDDGYYFARSGAQIPTSIAPQNGIANLPPDYPASTISIASDYVNVDVAQKATNWEDAPNGAKMRFGGRTYIHFKNSTQDYWMDSSSQSTATTLFTKEGRASMPNITNSSIKAYTLSLCTGNPNCVKNNASEPRYTDGGVSSSDTTYFANFNQWFYSLTGTNNLVDAKLCTSSLSCYAISDVPKVIYNGNLLSKVNNLWQKDNGTYLLKLIDNIYHNDTAIVNYAVGKAGNGLFYSECHTLKTNNISAINLCSSKEMRLPKLSETTAQTISGVQSCGGNTWTGTYSHNDVWLGDFVFYWHNSNYSSANYYSTNLNFRCVK